LDEEKGINMSDNQISSLQAKIIPVTSFQQNCSMIWCTKTMKGAFVDAGGDIDHLMKLANEEGVKIEKLFATHGHIDHVGASAELAERLSVEIEGPHEDDAFWIDQLPDQGKMFNFSDPVRSFTPSRWLHEGDQISVGEQTLDVLHCPGHTPGHVVFYSKTAQLAIVGDVLFKGSIGRTDFPRGDHETLLSAIRDKLWPLGDETVFIPGHGPISTFGEERAHNPFLK
jgi:glyoxylase-like metal-dependent hydrolase (beta-lactamase superfamily II)